MIYFYSQTLNLTIFASYAILKVIKHKEHKNERRRKKTTHKTRNGTCAK